MKYLSFPTPLWKTFLHRVVIFGMLIGARTASAGIGAVQIDNPIMAKSFPCLIQTISLAAIKVAIPIAVITIIVVGLRFVFAGLSGNSSKVTEATKLLRNVVIGTAIVVGSFAIASAAVSLFGAKDAPGTISCS